MKKRIKFMSLILVIGLLLSQMLVLPASAQEGAGGETLPQNVEVMAAADLLEQLNLSAAEIPAGGSEGAEENTAPPAEDEEEGAEAPQSGGEPPAAVPPPPANSGEENEEGQSPQAGPEGGGISPMAIVQGQDTLYRYNLDTVTHKATLIGRRYPGIAIEGGYIPINIPATVVHEGITYTVTAIADSPSSAPLFTSDGTYGFSITLPDTLEYIGAYAFRGKGGSMDTGAHTKITSLPSNNDLPPNLNTIGEGAFQAINTGAPFTIPDTVTSIGSYAFARNGFTEVHIGTGITEIPPYAFNQSENLTKIVVPDNIVTIGDSAFSNCKAEITEFILGSGLKTIGMYAFSSVKMEPSLTLILPEGLETIGASAFNNAGSITTLVIPNSVVSIGNSVFINSLFSEIIIGTGIVEIPRGAFQAMKNLTGFVIPDGVKSIGDLAFYETIITGDVYISKSVETIGVRAFENSKLSSITFEEGRTEELQILKSAFYTAQFEPEAVIVLPEGTTRIGEYGFHEVTTIKSITFPSTMKYIESKAFQAPDTGRPAKPIIEEIIFKDPSNMEFLGYSSGTTQNKGWQEAVRAIYKPEAITLPYINADFEGGGDVPGYDDTKVGETDDPTWLSKSAKWTNEDKTTAEVRFDFSYSRLSAVDYIFVLDTSGSMMTNFGQSKMYELIAAQDAISEVLLTTPGYDNRVAFSIFNTAEYSFTSKDDGLGEGGFVSTYDESLESYVYDLFSYGGTDYSAGLRGAYDLIAARTDTSRVPVVIFMTDGYPDPSIEGDYGLAAGLALREGSKADAVPPTPIFSITYDYRPEDYPTHPGIGTLPKISANIYPSEQGELDKVIETVIETVIKNVPIKLVDVISPYFTLKNGDINNIKVYDGEGNPVDITDVIELEIDPVTGKTTITWDLTEVELWKNHVLTMDLVLNEKDTGGFYTGELPTNDGDAVVTMTGEKTNEVASPVLEKEGMALIQLEKSVTQDVTDTPLFLFHLKNGQDILASAALENGEKTPWMAVDLDGAASMNITIVEMVPMEYGENYTVTITNANGSTATVSGKTVTIHPGDKVTITVTNEFEHEGYFKGGDSVVNEFLPA